MRVHRLLESDVWRLQGRELLCRAEIHFQVGHVGLSSLRTDEAMPGAVGS